MKLKFSRKIAFGFSDLILLIALGLLALILPLGVRLVQETSQLEKQAVSALPTPLVLTPPFLAEDYCQSDSDCPFDKACLDNRCQPPSCFTTIGGECEEYLYTDHSCWLVAKPDGTACGEGGRCRHGTCLEPTTEAVINFKIRFDGVTEKVPDQKVKIKLVGFEESKTFEDVHVTADANGVFSGTFVAQGIKPSGWAFVIKGPKHLAMKFCHNNQTNICLGQGNLTILKGENNFDFTGLKLLAGDIPDLNGIQDGVADSSDFAILVKALDEQDRLRMNSQRADLNFDRLNTGADIQLFLKTVAEKYADDF